MVTRRVNMPVFKWKENFSACRASRDAAAAAADNEVVVADDDMDDDDDDT